MLVYTVWRRALVMHYYEFFTIIRGNILWSLLCLPFVFSIMVYLPSLLPGNGEETQDTPPILIGITVVAVSLVCLALAGPATAAIYDYAARSLEGEAVDMKSYVRSLRAHFIKGYLIGAVNFLLLAALALNTWFYLTSEIHPFLPLLSILFLWGIVFWVAIQPYVFSVMIRLDTSVPQTFRNAVLLALDNLGVTVCMFGVHVIVLIIPFLLFSPIRPLFVLAYPTVAGSLIAHAHIMLLDELLERYEAKRGADDAAQSET